jgi:hypothetical protein
MRNRLSEQTARFGESVLLTGMCSLVMLLGVEFVMTFS